MLAIVRYINGRCFALVHLLAEISLTSHARVYDKMTCEKWPRSPRIITITKARKAHWLRVVLEVICCCQFPFDLSLTGNLLYIVATFFVS